MQMHGKGVKQGARSLKWPLAMHMHISEDILNVAMLELALCL